MTYFLTFLLYYVDLFLPLPLHWSRIPDSAIMFLWAVFVRTFPVCFFHRRLWTGLSYIQWEEDGVSCLWRFALGNGSPDWLTRLSYAVVAFTFFFVDGPHYG